MLKKIRELFKTEKGQGIVEYTLLLGFVAVVAAYLISGSDLIDTIKQVMDNSKEAISGSRL